MTNITEQSIKLNDINTVYRHLDDLERLTMMTSCIFGFLKPDFIEIEGLLDNCLEDLKQAKEIVEDMANDLCDMVIDTATEFSYITPSQTLTKGEEIL